MVKLIKYDLKAGLMNVYNKFFVYIGLIVLINVVGSNSIHNISKTKNIKPDIMDYICFVVGGPKHIPKGMLEIYVIPVLWIIIQVMIAYIVGYYAITDLNRYGQQILLRSVSRVKWWVSKIIWNVLMVFMMYAFLYFATFTTACLSGVKCEWILTEDIVREACNIDMLNGNQREILVILMVMPVLVSMTLSVFQMTIALIFSPIIGFISSQSIVFLSTIYEFKWLISNYAMLSHNRITCSSNIDYKEGLIICLVVFVISLVVGMVYFSNCNILPKNQEV